MQIRFLEKLARAQQAAESDLLLLIAPYMTRMPPSVRAYDEPFLPFGKEAISATKPLVCGYVFDMAAYLAIGAAGAIALERTLRSVGRERITILHGSFADESFSTLTDELAFESDAVTLANRLPLSAFLARDDRSAFVLNDSPEGYPPGSGVYHPQAERILIRGKTEEIITLRVAGEDVLYGKAGQDFAEHLQNALSALKAGSDA